MVDELTKGQFYSQLNHQNVEFCLKWSFINFIELNCLSNDVSNFNIGRISDRITAGQS